MTEPQELPANSRLLHSVATIAAHGPSYRPWIVLLVAVTAETAFLVALGAVQQTRLIFGIPGSLMALTAVVAGATGGPVVGTMVAALGAVIYYATVAGSGPGELCYRRWSPRRSGPPRR